MGLKSTSLDSVATKEFSLAISVIITSCLLLGEFGADVEELELHIDYS